MKDVPFDRWSEIMGRARRLKHDVLVSMYMTAALMVEAEISPEEMMSYLEERFLEA